MSENPISDLFIVDLTYTAPLDEIDKALPDHVVFLNRNYENGTFLMSGPKSPRTGGVILAKSANLQSLLNVIETDPFLTRNLAKAQVTTFTPKMMSSPLQAIEFL